MERPIRAAFVVAMLLAALFAPSAARAGGGPAPAEPCVPGTVWEDLASGVKYLCVYDELYGGPRWELLTGGQRGARAWLYRSSTYGCAFGQVGLTSLAGSGADAIVRTYRWPCRGAVDRVTQPAGELRSRVVIQVYDGSWATCRDSGYLYNTSTSNGWLAGLDMGAVADCGAGLYRAWGFGGFLQGSAWRGGSVATPSMSLR